MRIQTECMSFKNHWAICSSYDFQAHQQRSQRRCFSQTALLWFKVLPDLSPALLDLSTVLLDWLPAHLDMSPALRDLSPALLDLSPVLPDSSLALPGWLPAHPDAPRCTWSSLRCSEVFPNLTKSLQWYFCTSHQRSQLLWRPAGMPS